MKKEDDILANKRAKKTDQSRKSKKSSSIPGGRANVSSKGKSRKNARIKKDGKTSVTVIVSQKIQNELMGILLIGLAVLLFTGTYFEERGAIHQFAASVKWFSGGAIWYILFFLGYNGYLRFKGSKLFNSYGSLIAWIIMLPVIAGLLQTTSEQAKPGGMLGWFVFHHLALITSVISAVIILIVALLLLLMAALSLPLTEILKTPWFVIKAVAGIISTVIGVPLYWFHQFVLFVMKRLHRMVLWIIEDLSTIGEYIVATVFTGSGRDTVNSRFTKRTKANSTVENADETDVTDEGNKNGDTDCLVSNSPSSKNPEINGIIDGNADKINENVDGNADETNQNVGGNADETNDDETSSKQGLVPVIRGSQPDAETKDNVSSLKRPLLRIEHNGNNPDVSRSATATVNDDSTMVNDRENSKIDVHSPVNDESDTMSVELPLYVNDIEGEDPASSSYAKKENDNTKGTGQFKIRAKRAGKNAQLRLFTGVESAGDDNQSDDSDWITPSLSLFEAMPEHRRTEDEEILRSRGEKLIKTLSEFKIEAEILKIVAGPTITQFQIKPASGIKLSKITSLSNDIAMALACRSVRIEAPIPGKSAVGVEVPNEVSEAVLFSEIIDSPRFRNSLGKNHLVFALGKSIEGKSIIANLAKMPHLLVAGATGSGKSVCINTILSSILCRASPDEVRMLLIDPKMVELTTYNHIPHLISDVITNPQDAGIALRWAVLEMERRYQYLSKVGARNIDSYNTQLANGELYDENGDPVEGAVPMPYMVIVIDELADLMMVAAKEIEQYICRLAQMARAVGMHLIIATQRPSTNVITGVIKANFPSRIAFAVSSVVDSKVILDTKGAESLLGMGDMLYQPVGQPKPIRIQGAFITEDEVKRLTSFLKEQGKPAYIDMNVELVEANAPLEPEERAMSDDMWEPALRIAVELGEVSTSLIQRHLSIGYNRAAGIIDAMQSRGIISGQESGRRRKVLIAESQIGDFLG